MNKKKNGQTVSNKLKNVKQNVLYSYRSTIFICVTRREMKS